MAEMQKRVKQARNQLESTPRYLPRSIVDSSAHLSSQAPMAKRGALQRLWGPTAKELNVHIARWLLNDGLPYNKVVTEDFRSFVRLISGNTTVLAQRTYYGMMDASFERFCFLTGGMLSAEFRASYNLPFFNVLHDGCTTGSGKKGLVGTSASFIDLSWEFVNIALLVTVYNGSHDSCKIKTLITSRIKEFYGIDIESMAQFTMSDTAPSAKKVSKLFEDSLPTDCTMHVLNLCLVYGMGMRENYETVYLLDPTTNKPKKERRLAERLAKVQQFYCLPELKPIVDCDTHVASSVALFQRTILNYPALKVYFQHCESYDDPAVFEKFTFSEWRLLVKVEAITHSLADLARTDVQRSNQVSSELIVLMKYALDRLATDIPHLRSRRCEITKDKREIDALSDKAMICVNRIKGQVMKRLPTLTAESFTVDSLIHPSKLRQEAAVGGVVSGEGFDDTAGLAEDAGDPAHDVDTPPNLDLVPSVDDELRVFSTGAFVMGPLRTSTDNRRAEIQVLMKHNRAEIRRMEHASIRVCEKIDHAASL
ncbi:hypothetical protein PInf_022705 [Phytophthora infestans]|nr:hypothetical protein PInf_022705 [Phytophthora infestans]